jgi:hypothetical protein
VFVVVLVIRLVVIIIAVHIAIHKAHAQCSGTGLTLGVINILVVPVVMNQSVYGRNEGGSYIL